MDKEIIRYSHIHGISIIDKNLPNKFPSHWHSSAEFAFFSEKDCRFRINEQTYISEPGDIFLVWPRELHEITYAPENGYFLLQFSSNLIEYNTDLAAAMRFFGKCHHLSARKDPELCDKIHCYISDLRETYGNGQYFIETKCKIFLYQILLLIGEYVMHEHHELIGDELFSDKAWEYVRNACNFIAEHAAEDISQSETAGAVGLSPFYFSKLFKEYTSMTFPAYLTGIRVQNAINLLTNEKLSITECAYAAGFQSTTTFNKVFRETTGCSPKEYRKLHSNIHKPQILSPISSAQNSHKQ